MKANELYEQEIDISQWLDRVVKGTWTRNSDGTIDVDGDVFVLRRHTKNRRLPIQFNYITDSFFINDSNIDSLWGAPKKVGDLFNCADTFITSLEYAPEWVGNNFNCSHTQLTSLKGISKYIGGKFDCRLIRITEPYEYRYALFSNIRGDFISGSPKINDLIEQYGYDGTDSSKRNVAIGLKKLREYHYES